MRNHGKRFPDFIINSGRAEYLAMQPIPGSLAAAMQCNVLRFVREKTYQSSHRMLSWLDSSCATLCVGQNDRRLDNGHPFVNLLAWVLQVFRQLDISMCRYQLRMICARSHPKLLTWPGGSSTFVFLHGFLGAAEDWLPVMESLAAAGHRCLAIDLPAHGATQLSGPGTAS